MFFFRVRPFLNKGPWLSEAVAKLCKASRKKGLLHGYAELASSARIE
jgi:hypothetical protein